MPANDPASWQHPGVVTSCFSFRAGLPGRFRVGGTWSAAGRRHVGARGLQRIL